MSNTQQQEQQGDAKAESSNNNYDRFYEYDASALGEIRKTKAWMNDAKYFSSVAVAPSAIFKILSHCQSGVDKGMKQGNGNPIEVMGLLLGRPDTNTENGGGGKLIVTDAFPLPIEGFETRVVADDDNVHNHMIMLSDSLESTRQEKVMGWYHSHPFDLGTHSHCFLSSTDISTQLLWQRSEDPYGNPFLAIVVDPLRSLHKNRPELKAFRCYPPEYASPVHNECPDGSIVVDEQARIAMWGAAWNRYYELQVEFFMSNSAQKVMNTLTQSFLWMRTLGSTPMLEAESRAGFCSRVCNCAEKLGNVNIYSTSSGRSGSSVPLPPQQQRSIGQGVTMQQARGGQSSATTHIKKMNGLKEDGEFSKARDGVVELATERTQGNISQAVKSCLFN
uniref:COP9 signalosome complex subunit 5 n=1 Tax=Leptocylindrus danicus TaxID=163516 RepID=A0A7S2NUU7_9STRA|mmetsp:Transcript_14772/g.21821  ORF Transcript_14772/g.21821 Transcript_14772/m.21821 type:complete len:391 (+) Transcript_14772:43-1215(+)|eukprot:CAMPEP_0116008980 /NCGR_PEP_ID=MMETSP0321-20121206/3174_1 /TAXON_ID=163516 /ORGANISM="Leptocylindrus danicus var. danicus, Strain B650" /LENGTH=390 /DNA_ID=CAMNT_0003477883 /DNA_START=25 /DNA_END=1197 /DNA_ORIENTATION=-